jgi:hypothetical protein
MDNNIPPMAQSKPKPCYGGKPWSLCQVTTLLPEHYQHPHSSSLQRLLKQERRHHIRTQQDKKFIQPWTFLRSLSKPREMSVNLTTNQSFTLHNIHISFQYPTDPYTHASYSGGETKAAPAGCLSVHYMTFDVQLVYKGLVGHRSGGATCHLSSDTKSFQSASL